VKQLMVANKQKTGKSRYFFEKMETMLQAQIDNMLELGWRIEDIILLTNFNFEFMGIKAEVIELNDFCLTGSKLFALRWLFENSKIEDIVWAHDIDAWANIWFDCPVFEGDVGCVQYSNPKFNGGSIFWKPEAKDIVNEIIKILTEEKAKSEEPTLNKIFKSEKYKNRISILNSTYNVGCSGFAPRYERSLKPIRVCHFHPNNSVAWEIFAHDRDGIGEIAVTVRLEKLLRKYYPNLAIELKDKSISQKKREQRKEKEKRRKEKHKQSK